MNNTLTKMNSALADTMLRYSIGLDPWFFERNSDSGFPPHDIEELAEDHFRLTLAVAGFTREDLDITLHGDLLTVSGSKKDKDTSQQGVLYRGIGYRDFSRQFKIGDWVEIAGADLVNGLLKIDLVRRVPETLKPRTIEIGTSSPPQISG